jgi:nitrous oxide reductase accessory protein NosL
MLKTLGASAAVGVGATATGCIGGNGDDEDGNETDDGEDDDANETDTDDGTETAEPVDFPEDAECPVCNMMSAEYPDWNAQVVHEDGDRAYLCTSGCMTAYKAYPEEFSVSDSSGAGSDIAGVWVTGYETREVIDGKEAEYALENDPERVDDPMMVNPAPFEEREDAVAYVEEVDHLTEEDIVGYDELDAETADMYRGQLTPVGEEA